LTLVTGREVERQDEVADSLSLDDIGLVLDGVAHFKPMEHIVVLGPIPAK